MTVEALFWPAFILLCGCIAAVVWALAGWWRGLGHERQG